MIIRIWMVYPFTEDSLQRDGIPRTLFNLINALLLEYEIKIEIWCLDFTKQFIQKGLAQFCKKSIASKIVFYTGNKDNLVEKINKLDDKEAILLIFSVNAFNYEQITHGHGVLIIHDLLTIVHKKLFSLINSDIDLWNKTLISKLNSLTKRFFFITISQFIQNEHILKHINISKDNTDYVHLPYIPSCKSKSGKQILDKLKIDCKYIIFPSQIRPYKNVEVLLQALVLLKKSNINIKLLLTGNLEDFPPVLLMARGNDLINDIF